MMLNTKLMNLMLLHALMKLLQVGRHETTQ